MDTLEGYLSDSEPDIIDVEEWNHVSRMNVHGLVESFDSAKSKRTYTSAGIYINDCNMNGRHRQNNQNKTMSRKSKN
eukprot:UN02305